MNYYLISALINFISSFALGGLVLYRNPKGIVNSTFALFAFSAVLWSFSYYIWQTASTAQTALFWSRALMAFAIFIPIFYLHFVFAFLGVLNEKKKFLIFSYFLFICFFLLNLLTPQIVSHTEPLLEFPFWPIPGSFFHALLLVWLGYMTYSIHLLYRAYRDSIGLKKQQVRYLLLSMLIGFGGGITNYFLWYKIPIYPLGNILVSVDVAVTAYAIAKHRLLDIRFVIARTVAYSLLLLIIASSYTIAMLVFSSYFFGDTFQGNQLLVSTFFTIIVAFTFQPLRKALEHTTDKFFFKGMYETHDLLAKLSHIMATTLLLDTLTEKVLHELVTQMRISRGAFVLMNKGDVILIETSGYTKPPGFTHHQLFTLESAGKTLVFEEMEDGTLKDLMRKLDLTVVIPLKTSEKEVGLLMLGEKLSGDIYSDQDIKVLEILAPEISVAIQNSLSYEEIRRFNITLKVEIDHATKKLRETNEKLQEVDKLKDEFVSVATHELRTPMTAIKSYLWLILHKKDLKLDQKIHKYLDRAFISSERMLVLINDLLNLSRIESGRIQLEIKPTNLNEIVDETLAEIMPKAVEKSLQLIYNKPKGDSPKVMVDPQRFPEIVTNFAGNSIKFTPNGGKITVTATKKDNMIQIDVSDTGVGISKEDQKKLFKKFGRLDSSYKAVATSGGTGLGLYITKNLIELQGGKVWVESDLGKGATFSFTVPVAKESDIKKAVKEEDKPLEGVYVNEKALSRYNSQQKSKS
ncbi:MAG: ATP-binding protein [Patescibacteria group bacterium]|nr:ATP-binding protein [Patescibacteria group bacterium]